MTRTIKFRGKNSKDEWVYGSLIINETENEKGKFQVAFIVQGLPCASDGGDFYTARMERVKIETIGQYTGLYDKNGKEIYEGDIVKTRLSKNFFGIVTWHTDGYFFFDTSNGEWKRWSDGYRPAGEMLRIRCDGACIDFEVVGNIFDNQELQKK